MAAILGPGPPGRGICHPPQGWDIRTVAFNAQAHILPHRHLAVRRDITAQKVAESALRQSEERFASAFHASPTLMVIIHLATGRVVDLNESALRCCGYPRTAVVGRPIRTRHLWADLAACDGLLARLCSENRVRDFLATLRTAAGLARQCRLAAAWITLGGEPHVLIRGEDITEQIAAEAEVAAAAAAQQAAHARLRQLHALQAELVRTVSHEFRTPLTAVQGLAALLQSEEFPPAQVREYAATIHGEAVRLGQLITRLLAVDQLDAAPPGARVPLDVNALLVDAVAQVTPAAPAHPITLDLAPDLPPVAGDGARLTEAVRHLLDNAIAYSPGGGPITVRSALVASQIQIEIQDSGIGIPADALDLIFERYIRLPVPLAERRPGLGLGLALVCEIVRQHGGQVWAESTPGVGTTLVCTLPPAAVPASAPPASRRPQAAA